MEIFLVGLRNSYLEKVKFPIFNIKILHFVFLFFISTSYDYVSQHLHTFNKFELVNIFKKNKELGKSLVN